MLEPIEHAGLQRGVDFTEGKWRRSRSHQAQAFGDDGVWQRPDLEPCKILRRLHGLLCQHAARAEIISPGYDADVATLEQGVLDRLRGAIVEGLGLLLEAREERTEGEGAVQLHDMGRNLRAR